LKDLERSVEISEMLRLYSGMLTPRQLQAAVLYFDNDQSLAEIAEQLSITRQSVKDSLAASVKKLYELENALNLQQKSVYLDKMCSEAIGRAGNNAELKKLLEQLRVML